MATWRLCLFTVFSWAALGCARQPEDSFAKSAAHAGAPDTATEKPILNLDTWADYIAPNVIPNFELETGIKVRINTFDSDQILETQMLIGHSGYDVVTPSAPFFQRQRQAGVYRKLDKSALTNYGNRDPEMLKRLAEYDPGNEYAVPYLHTTVGIAYNVDKLSARLGGDVPNSWALMFDPTIAGKLKDCGVAYADSPIQVLSAAIQYLGKDPRLMLDANVAAASRVLQQVRPYMRYIDSAKQIGDLASGDICIALTWAGDAAQARERANAAGKGIKVAYVIPKEGGQIVIDAIGIPSDAPHPLNALRWLNYLMRANVMADISNYLRYANGNAASVPLLTEDVKADSSVYPDVATQRRLINAISPSRAYSLIVNREWTRFRAGT